jgi:hypothetical protein
MPTAGSSRPPSITTSPSRASSLPRSRSSSPPIQSRGKKQASPLQLKDDTMTGVAAKPPSDDEGEDEVEPEEVDEDEEVESLSKDKAASTKRFVACFKGGTTRTEDN